MSQHIGIERIDERGNFLERCDVNFVDVISRFETISDYKTKYPLLSYIDPYGNTYLNILQRPDFVQELIRFSKEQNFEITKKLLDFVNDTDVHQYIKFVGD